MSTSGAARAVTLGSCELPSSDARLLLSSPSCWLTDPLLHFYFEHLQQAGAWRLQHCRFVSPQSAAVIMHEKGQTARLTSTDCRRSPAVTRSEA